MTTVLLVSSSAFAAITVTPSTWNVIGLDSNSPAFGPNRFPVGAKVCSDTVANNVPVIFSWDTGGTDNGTYINLRSGSSSSINIDIPAGGCTDAFFEVELSRTSAAFDQTRRFYITASGVSTPRPREIKVERLVSQSRNAITDMAFGTSVASLTSVPNGGSMDLIVGNTYYIRMSGYTATQGYEQLESFVNFPNTIFQILSVKSTYSADTSPIVNSPNDKLYADSCGWDSDPTSPSYLSCWADGKAGGTVSVTYEVTILSTGTGRETLKSLIHDFSGSSFHYNADFSSSARFANLIDPTSVTISKNFTPDPVVSNGMSSLLFTLTNPNSGTVSDVSFVDTFPTVPDAMTVASPLLTTNSCGGTLADASGNSLDVGDTGISLSGASISAYSSCSVKVNITAATQGTYTNTSDNLFVGSIDTGNSATDTLTIDDNAVPPPPPPPDNCATAVEIARWDMTSTTVTSKASDVSTATATSLGGSFSIETILGNPANSWRGSGWATNSPASANPYYLFSLDTSNYGGASIALEYYVPNGEWANSANNYLTIDTQADLGGFSPLTPVNLGTTSTWVPIPATGSYSATATGASTTDFKIRAYGAKTNPAPGNLYIDNVVFYGCERVDPPSISKTFAPDPVAVGGTTTLTFTVTNPSTDNALSGLAFSDSFPPNLTIANPLTTSNTCGGLLTDDSGTALSSGDTGIQLSGGSLAISGSCTLSVDVTPSAAGTYENISGFVSATESGANTAAGGSAFAQLVALPPPTIEKVFGTNPVYVNDSSQLTFTITNPSTGSGLSGLAFTDTYPAGLVNAAAPNAATTCTGGLVTVAAGSDSVTLSGGSVAANSSCTVTVDVTSATAGTYVNTSGVVSHILNGTWNGNTATDTLLVETPNPGIALLKQVSDNAAGPWSSYLPVSAGDPVYYKFTVENSGDVQLSSVNVVDDGGLPASLSMASCSWFDGDNNPLAVPFMLPVADADNGHLASCVLGPATAVSGNNPNTATASGTFSGTTVTDSSTATYATSTLTLTKTAAEAYFLAAGDSLNYSYTINNTGAAVLAGPLSISVTDNKISSVTCPALTTIGDNDIDFDPGESLTCTASYTVTGSDVTNRQVSNIARANVGGFFTPTATETVNLAPDLSVVKSNDTGGTAATNMPFLWNLTVINSSSAGAAASFSDGQTILTDDLPSSGATFSVPAVASNAGGTSGVISCAISTNTLTCSATGVVSIPPGDSFSIAITTTPSAPATLDNPRSGGNCQVDPNSLITETNDTNNSCADSVTVVTPAITLIKTADILYFLAAGDTINYSYKVSNTGAVPQAGPVSVADDKTTVTCPLVSTVGNGDANLDPAEEVTCTAAYTVLAADVTAGLVTNTATATVGAATTPQVSLTVPVGPDLSATKTNDLSALATTGVLFNWTLAVTNAPIAGVSADFADTELLLVDDLPAAGATYNLPVTTATSSGGATGTVNCAIDGSNTLSCSAAGPVSIPPGGGFSIVIETTPTISGSLANPRGGGSCQADPGILVSEIDETNNDCSDTVTAGAPSLTVLKSADRANAAPGDIINYTVIISNTGPVLAKEVKVVDAMGRFTALGLDPFGNGTPFNFTPQTSGVTVKTIEYSNDTDPSDGVTYGYTPSAPSGFDSDVTYWRITMDGDMNPTPSQFTLRYQAQVE